MAKSYHSTALPIDAPVITLRSGDSLPCSSVGNPPLPQSKSCKP